jgi:prevent-host-death family protein
MAESSVSVAEASSSLGEIVDRVAKFGDTALIVENGTPLARIVPVNASPKTADEFLKSWPTLHHLTPEEAANFEADILAARQTIPSIRPKWD